MRLAKPTIKDGKLHCPCGYQFGIDLIAGSGMRMHTSDKTEIEISFDEIRAICPDCTKLNIIESSLFDEVLKPKQKQSLQTRKFIARLRTDKIGLSNWRYGVERLIARDRDKFIETLSDNQRKVYKAMSNPEHKTGTKVFDAIKAELPYNALEIYIQFLTIKSLIKKFHTVLFLQRFGQKFSLEEIKEIYTDINKYKAVIDAGKKLIDPKDKRDKELYEVQKTIWLIDLIEDETIKKLKNGK